MKMIFSHSTVSSFKYDLLKLKARIKNFGSKKNSKFNNLHLGCGSRKVQNWLNVDLYRSDQNVDIGSGSLPWKDDSFNNVVSQHVIEHLELESELIPLVIELRRVLIGGGKVYISTPDLEKVCKSYVEDKAKTLLEDRIRRFPNYSLSNIPSQHFINKLFNQSGEHKNLFDFEMLEWLFTSHGFRSCRRINESKFLKLFPEFPLRNDDVQSLYIVCEG